MIPAAVTGDMVNDINGTEIMPTMLSPPFGHADRDCRDNRQQPRCLR